MANQQIYAKYNNYALPTATTSVTILKRVLLSPRRRRVATRETWIMRGKFVPTASSATKQSEISSSLLQLRRNFGVDGGNLGLYFADGSATDHVIRSGDTIGGVVVKALNFPTPRGAEYATYRTFELICEAEYRDAEKELLDFSERLTFSGGGPRFVFLQPLTGDPVKQQVAQRTPYRVVQSGYALGYSRYPTRQPPIWPGALHADKSPIEEESPRDWRNVRTHYRTTWRYLFESVASLSGHPNVRNN